MNQLSSMNKITLLGSLAIILTIVGCQKDELSFSNDRSEVEGFLHVEDLDLIHSDEASKEIFIEALLRMEIKVEKDYFMSTPYSSGKEINISENLYSHFSTLIDEANLRQISSKKVKYSVVRNKIQIEDGSQQQQTTASDCMAHAVSNLPGGPSLEKAREKYESKYGLDGGVPLDNFEEALKIFVPGNEVPVQNLNHGPVNGVVLVRINAVTSHAINIFLVDRSTGTVATFDHQNNNEQVIYHFHQITNAFVAY